MSRARPMSATFRELIYLFAGLGGPGVETPAPGTVRQRRQLKRMGKREQLRGAGELTHGATGLPVRHPRPPRYTFAQMRGSITTHQAAHCPPCPDHDRPRLHRVPKPAVVSDAD